MGQQKTLSTSEIADLYDITPRQLQWWDEAGIVSPRIIGGRRCYSTAEAQIVEFVAKLRKWGFSLTNVRKLISDFKARPAGATFAVVQKRVTWCQSRDTVLDVIKSSRHASYLIEVM